MTHRRLLSLFAAATTFAAPLAAQQVTADDLGGVPISIAIPASNSHLTDAQADQLGSKLLQVVNAGGMSGIGAQAGFVLAPYLTVTRRMQAGELRAMQVLKADLALTIKQTAQNITFSSTSVTLTGSGDTDAAALTDAIASMSTESERLRTFVETGKRRIIGYYETNCAAVRSDAKGKAGTGQVDQAIALLMSVPREATTCQPTAAGDAEKLFAAYQARECAQLVRGARADAANRSYDDAIEKLQKVDPSSPCTRDADALIANIEQQVGKTEDRSFQLRLKTLRSERETITQSLTDPTRIVERRRDLTKGVAVDVIRRLPVRSHVPARGAL
jgi:hypothetical protein